MSERPSEERWLHLRGGAFFWVFWLAARRKAMCCLFGLAEWLWLSFDLRSMFHSSRHTLCCWKLACTSFTWTGIFIISHYFQSLVVWISALLKLNMQRHLIHTHLCPPNWWARPVIPHCNTPFSQAYLLQWFWHSSRQHWSELLYLRERNNREQQERLKLRPELYQEMKTALRWLGFISEFH